MPTKKTSQKLHLEKRSGERLSRSLTKADQKKILKLIQDGKSRPIRKQSNRVTIHRIKFEDEVFEVVYDKQRKQIITILV